MADKSWISRLFGRSNSESRSPNSTSSASSSPISVRSPQLSVENKSLMKDLTPSSANGSSISPVISRNVMYFSPESALNSKSISAPVPKTVTSVDTTLTRKRQLTNFDHLDSTDNSNLASSRIKRFREGLGNTSLIEAPLRANTMSSRLDATWAGCDSPSASSASLKSKISLAPSVNTKLSTKTRAILEQLERISTPALEAKRTSIIRPAVATEKWSSSILNGGSVNKSIIASSSTPPPLRRQSLQVSNRAQVLSSTMATLYKKPYWRDLSRKETPKISEDSTDSVVNVSIQSVKNNAVIKVSPLFDITPSGSSKERIDEKNHKCVPILKGSDGSNVASKNTFSAHGLDEVSGDEEEEAANWMSNGASLPAFAAPTQGFLNDAIFSFATPAQRGPSQGSGSDSSDDSDSGSISNSEDDKEINEIDSSAQTRISNNEDDKRPATSATVTSDSQALSNAATPASSKNASPQGGAGAAPAIKPVATWDCPNCFCSNKITDSKCPACQYVVDAKAAAAAPAFGVNTFGADKGNTESPAFSFGLKTNNAGNQSLAKTEIAFNGSKVFGGSTKPNTESAVAIQRNASSSITDRSDWDCPECFCSNKAADDKCPACLYVKYKSENAGPVNAFGDKAFKPETSAPKITFGFGTSTTNGSASIPSFGSGLGQSNVFGSAKSAEQSLSKNELVNTSKEATGKSIFGFSSSTSVAAAPVSVDATEKNNDSGKIVNPPTTTNGIFGTSNTALSSNNAMPNDDGVKTSTFETATPTSSIFGAAATSIKPLFGTSSSLTASITPIFGASSIANSVANASSVTNSVANPSIPTVKRSLGGAQLFAASADSLFGPGPTALFPDTSSNNSVAGGTTSIFGSSANPFTMGQGNKPPLFGSSAAGSVKPSETSVEGEPSTKKTSQAAAPASTANNTSFQFGAPSTNGFSFGSSAPTLTSSSSTPSLGMFASTTSTVPTSTFGAPNGPPTTFNFGGASAAPSGAAPFQFGSATTSAPSQPFVFGSTNALAQPNAFNAAPMTAFGATQPAAPSPFAFSTSSGAGSSVSAANRKTIAARRRLTKR